MGFYMRKSIKAGPFRFNLSKSGIGVSTGIPGLRVGTGPRGTYVHLGRHGMYYRKTVGAEHKMPRQPATNHLASTPPLRPASQVTEEYEGVTMLALEACASSELVSDLNTAAGRSALWPFNWLHGRRHVPVFYEVTDDVSASFDALVEAFSAMSISQRAWIIDASAELSTSYQRKVNAGATSLVQRTAVRLTSEPPQVLATNILVPAVIAKAFSIYFLPDQMLVRRGKRFGGWPYQTLDARTGIDRFIESGTVPGDAIQVGETWQYVNKNGGPDRRFNNNRRLPILGYGELELEGHGLRLRLQTSSQGAAHTFGAAVASMIKTAIEVAASPKVSPEQTSSPAPDDASWAAAGWYPDPTGQARLRFWDGAGWTAHVA